MPTLSTTMQSTFPSQSDHASPTCGLLPHNSLEISSLDDERDTPVEEWSGRVTPVEEFLIGEGISVVRPGAIRLLT